MRGKREPNGRVLKYVHSLEWNTTVNEGLMQLNLLTRNTKKHESFMNQ
jgi:hypothetical protein